MDMQSNTACASKSLDDKKRELKRLRKAQWYKEKTKDKGPRKLLGYTLVARLMMAKGIYPSY
jgi:hypothetical protein